MVLGPVLRGQADISVANTSRYLGSGQWEWTIFVQGDPASLGGIEWVEYKLHPTFPKPLERRVQKRGTGSQAFPFTATGWGFLEIPVTVHFRGGGDLRLRHMLKFELQPVEEATGIRPRNVAREISTGHWEWTAYIEAPDRILAQVRCVEYTLHETFPNPVREVCQRGAVSV